MEKEIWKKVECPIDRYYISSIGRIKSVYKHRPERILKPPISQFGYYRMQLCYAPRGSNKRIFKNELISVLVARAFIPNPENKPEVNHINSNRLDNRVENLEWVTRSENQLHAHRVGFQDNKGVRNPKCKLSESDVLDIYKMKGTLISIAIKYDLKISAIHRIKTGLAWSHVTGKKYVPIRPKSAAV